MCRHTNTRVYGQSVSLCIPNTRIVDVVAGMIGSYFSPTTK